MVGYGGKLDYHDQPRLIKTKQDQPRSNQGQLNENQSSALIALALFRLKIIARILSNFSSEPQASNYVGNKATYTILDLKPRQSMLINAYLNIPADAQETSTYPVSVSMGSLLNQSDADLEDNTDEVEAGPMNGSEGKVFKKAITGDTSSITDDIIGYNIQCVNATGGVVKRVVFIDTLDADYKLMDANLTYFSHPHVKRWSVGRVLVVEIPDANLADREAIPSRSTASIECSAAK